MVCLSLLLVLIASACNSAGQSASQAQQAVNGINPPPAPATTSALTSSGIKIDFMLSNYWNNSMFLAQSNPSIEFISGASYTQVSINSTATTPDIIGVEVKENRAFQTMLGLGAGITDATCIVLQDLKEAHPDAYDEILNLAFNDSPAWMARGGAGMNMVRTVIGAADFGFQQYTYCDTVDGSPDPTLSQFNIDKSPKRWAVLQDIKEIQPNLIIMATPWSQPAWMKGHINGSLQGGSVLEKYEDVFGDYMVRFVKELDEKKGLKVQRISLQNEPLYDGAQYPCTKMTSSQQARIGSLTRKKLDAAGYEDVGILAYDHNWDASQYPIEVLDTAQNGAFTGAAWHCYGGNPSGQRPFNDAYPNKEVWFTECTRISQFFEEPWENIKKQFSTLITGSINFNSMAMILWNMALQVTEEGFTRPSLPRTCLNCLAPFHVLENATTNAEMLDGMNASGKASKSRRALLNESMKFSKHAAHFMRREQKMLLSPAPNTDYNPDDIAPAGAPISTNPSTKLNEGAMNADQSIPPTRPTYYRTSDFSTLAHLGLAIRPTDGSDRWGTRMGVVTTEDGNEYSRITAQLFRRDLGNATSRWSLILLQQNDHQGYNYAAFEDMTVQIKFRNSTAQLVIPPGVYTLQWTAPNIK